MLPLERTLKVIKDDVLQAKIAFRISKEEFKSSGEGMSRRGLVIADLLLQQGMVTERTGFKCLINLSKETS